MASRICYPPITYSSLPAFPAGTDLMFRFNIPNLNAKNDIKSIQFVVNFQTNNKSAVRREQWHTDIIFIPWSSVREDSLGYYVYIGSDNLTNGWEAGLYYRIQARFGLIEGPEQVGFDWEDWAEWSQHAAENNLLTEWSTVTIVKAITRPTVSIINLTDSSAEAGNQFVSSSLSTFVGAYYSSDPQEIVDTYRFIITDQNGTIVADSGTQHHNAADDYYIVEYINDNSVSINTSLSEFSVLNSLKHVTSISNEGNYFNFIHNNTTHEPHYINTNLIPSIWKYNIPNDDMKKFKNEFSVRSYYANCASIKNIITFIHFLKENSVYDNTKIIIVSDHAWDIETDFYKDNELVFMSVYNSLLMYKDFNSTNNFNISSNLMTVADVPYLASIHLEKHINPFTHNIITNDYKYGELNLIILNEWQPDRQLENRFNFDKYYRVKGSIFDKNNWELRTFTN